MSHGRVSRFADAGRLATARRTAVTLLLAVTAVAWAPAGHGATLTIDHVGDVVDAVPGDGLCRTAGGVCTLRAAVQEANALPGPDVIVCTDQLAGTVTFALPGAGEDFAATGDLDIRDDLDIDGDCERQNPEVASPLQVDAAGLDRAFHVVAGVVSIRAMRIAGGLTGPGQHGGGILNESTLTLASPFVYLSGHTAGGDGGGLYNAGTVTGDGASFIDNTAAGSGGGIANVGTLSASQLPLYGNSAPQGGGIDNRGILTLRASPISGNHATAGAGGGLLNATGATAHLGNGTVSGNTAGSGADGIENLGTGALHNVTVIDHATLGVRNDDAGGATLTVTNTLLSDSCGGTITSAGYNVTTGCALAGDPTGNQLVADPVVTPVATCNTIAYCPRYEPGPGSPLVDAGNPAGCTDHLGNSFGLDQRGALRTSGAACDVGAVESARACENGLSTAGAKLIVSRLGTGPQRQTLRFAARVPVFPAYPLPPPNLFGAQIAVDDLGAGTSWFERSQRLGNPLSRGGSIPFSCGMWVRRGEKYTYREVVQGCPDPPTGGRVRKVQVKDNRQASPSEILVKLTVTDLTLPLPVQPIRVTFTFGDTAILSSLGRCAEQVFIPEQCRLSGSRLRCE